MYVFIDDSGDAGFRLGEGSSDSLVIACCVFPDADSAELAAGEIRKIRSELGWHTSHEFKFSKTRADIRMQFLVRLAKQNFFIRAIVLPKKDIYSDFLKTEHKSFYNFAIQSVLSNSGGTIQNASIRIDGSGGREYRKAAIAYFRRESQAKDAGIIRRVSFVDSHRDQLIQLADMVAGSIRCSHDSNRVDSGQYLGALNARIRDPRSDIWVFGVPR